MRPREDAEEAADTVRGASLPGHLYAHIPFCRARCSYCDFASTDVWDADFVTLVLRAIESEILFWARSGLPGVLETIYVGGGTPTLVGPQLIGVLNAALDNIPVRSTAEVTVEGNPDSITYSLVNALAAAGVTRMSVGVQSFVDSELGMLGRMHNAAAAHNACAAVVDSNLDLSVDLMCGIPGQTHASWGESLAQALETGAHHISVYPLTLEEGTPLAVACDTGLAPEPDPDLQAEMMVQAEETLAVAGIERYEVANFAVPGHESQHNTAYWTGRQYLGAGPGAHGMLDASTARAAGLLGPADSQYARVRTANAPDASAWLAGGPTTFEFLTAEEAAREDIMLGMRLARGVAERDAQPVRRTLEALRARGLVELLDEGTPRARWRTTRAGWLLGNEVFGAIWGSEDDWHSL